MFRGNRGQYIALGIALLLAILAGAWLYADAAAQQRVYEHQATEKAKNYRDSAHKRAEARCVLVSRPEIRNCVYEEYESARKGEHDEYDLQAQLVTSVWTRAMGIAALIAMAVGIFGVGLIYTTFQATRLGATAAKLGQRPWLDFTIKLEGISVHYESAGYQLQLEIKVKNSGNNPANFIRSETAAYLPLDRMTGDIVDELTQRDVRIKELTEEVAARLLKTKKEGATVFPRENYSIYAEPNVPWDFNEGYPCDYGWLVIGLRYAFEGGEGQTIKVFRVRSFEFVGVNGFKGLGQEPFGHVKTRALIDDWTSQGRAD